MPTAQANSSPSPSPRFPTDVIRFDLFLDSEDSRITELVDELYLEFVDNEERTNQRRAESQIAKVKKSIRLLIVNLIKARNVGARGVHLSLNRSVYTTRWVYNVPFLAARQFFSILDNFEDMGYMELDRSEFVKFNNNLPQSCVRMTDALKETLRDVLDGQQTIEYTRIPNEPFLLVRSKWKKLSNFTWDEDKRAMQDNVVAINEHLKATNIDICLTDAEHTQVETRLRRNAERRAAQTSAEAEAWEEDDENESEFNLGWLDLNKKTLHRIFNVSLFTRGGRFYGGWWISIPKEFRPYITINGEPTVEVDYDSMHVSLLYSLEELEKPDGDGYLPDAYLERPEPERKAARDLFKKLMTRAIGGQYDVPSTNDKVIALLRQFNLTYTQAMEILEEKHSAVKHLFFKKKARLLQNMDSQIAEGVILKLKSEGTTVLPIHDSFVVPASAHTRLRTVLKEVYVEVVNRLAPHKTDKGLDASGVAIGVSRLNEVREHPDLFTKYLNRNRQQTTTA